MKMQLLCQLELEIGCYEHIDTSWHLVETVDETGCRQHVLPGQPRFIDRWSLD